MSKKLYEESSISAIADAIRNKNGSSNSYIVSQMASAISQIAPTPVLQAKTATSNGIVLPDSDYDGLSQVTVQVPSSTPVLQEKTVTQNGIVLPDSDYDGLSQVTVQVSSSTPVLQEKTTHQNGLVVPDQGYDGLSQVTVDIPSGGGSSGVYVGTTDPDASIGSNGEYYYLREEDNLRYQGYNETLANTTNQSQGGYEFTANADCYVIGLYAWLGIENTNIVNLYLCAADGTILAEIDNISITSSNTWVYTELQNPIHLTSGENYVVLVRRLSGTGNLKYTQSRTHKTSDLITFVNGRYGASFPGNRETNTRYSADVELVRALGKYFFVKKQYYKENNAWIQIR